MAEVVEKEFGKWRSMLWPIHAFELKKVLPMCMMFFCVLFNYTVLRDTKDTLIVSAPGSGAEAIPFIKLWLTLPCAVIFTLVYIKLSNVLSKQKLFYATVSFFLVFFAIFALFMYPNKDILHPTASADWLQATLPQGAMGMIAIYRNWTYAIFYVMSELWGSAILSLVLWGFANEITKVSEAKRFYSLFPLIGNIGLIVSGTMIVHFSNIRQNFAPDVDAWGVTLNYMVVMVLISGFALMGAYAWMQKYVMTDPRFFDASAVKKKKSKTKMSLKDSFVLLARSKYLLCLCAMVIAYGVAINLIEVTWKGQLKLQYPNENDYQAFMGNFSRITGAFSMFMMMFVGHNVIRRLGWGVAAIITPLILLLTGGAFFSFVLFKDNLTGAIAILGTTPLMLAVMIGMSQNVLSKGTKYALFDLSKEIAYIPLDSEQRLKGKAAIDVIGARLGKSGGALVQSALLIGLGSLAAIGPYVAALLIAIIGVWVIAVRILSREFTSLTAQREEEAKAEAAEKAAATAAEVDKDAAAATEQATAS